jgi:hypothetical protein
MRFLVLMIPGNKTVDGAAMRKFNEELAQAGVLLAMDGLHPTPQGARVRFGAAKPAVSDGPFPEARETICGFWLWQVKSKAEALEWARRCPAEAGDVLELRQIFEPAQS